MKKSYLGILALAALGFAACTDSESLVDNSVNTNGETPENAINFTTYLGGAKSTRAGYNGTIDTDVLKTNATNTGTQATTDGANGFGVFAYYTGNYTYGQYMYDTYTGETGRATNTTSEQTPNFMYNQQVKWDNDLSDAYITKWTYSPIKYWPNEVQNGAVDDQDNDAADNPATGSSTYGGNVSFFAYAPYVEVTASTGAPKESTANYNDGADLGITAVTANGATGDPKVTYVLYKAASAENPAKLSNVDLLWGTYNSTSQNVVNAGNVGVAYGNNASANTYQKAILPHETATAGTYDGYKVNADLTKQKTNGTIGFAFKHALAGLGGGSNVSSGIGFQVVLDIDDMKGAEQGGERESFTKESVDYFRTIVTIKDIEISNDLNDDNDAEDGGEVKLAKKGTFNLATGQWTVDADDKGVVEQTIGTTASGESITNALYAATLSKKIAEYKYYTSEETKTAYINNDPAAVLDYFKKESIAAVNTGSHPGVTEEAQNVFEDENQTPLMFIPESSVIPALRITVDYIVRTYDEALKGGYTEVEQKISKKITFPANAFKLNTHYNLLMHLGLTGVKFTATVDDWDEGTFVDSDGDGNIEESDIYLPRNVAGIQSVAVAIPANQTFASTSSSSSDAQSLGAVTLTMSDGTTHVSTETTEQSNFAFSAGSDNIEVTANEGVPSVKFKAANTTLTPKEGTVNVTYGSATGPHTTTITVTQSPRILTPAVTVGSITTSSTEATVTVKYSVTESDGTTSVESDQDGTISEITAQYGDKTATGNTSPLSLISLGTLTASGTIDFSVTYTAGTYGTQTATKQETISDGGGAKRR